MPKQPKVPGAATFTGPKSVAAGVPEYDPVQGMVDQLARLRGQRTIAEPLMTPEGLPSIDALPMPGATGPVLKAVQTGPDLTAESAFRGAVPAGLAFDGKIRLPQSVDPAIVARVADDLQRASVLQGVAGLVPTTAYGVKRGRNAGTLPGGPTWDAAKAQAAMPLQTEQARVDRANQLSGINNAMVMQLLGARGSDLAQAGKYASDYGGALAQREAQKQQADLTKAGLESAERVGAAHDAARIRAAEIAAQKTLNKPPATKERADNALLQNVGDNLRTVSEMMSRHGSLANLKDKIGLASRALNVAGEVPLIGGVAKAVTPSDPDTQALLQDAQRYENALAGLVGNTALGLEPRRVAIELQRKMNEQFPGAGADADVAKEALGRIGKHVTQKYRLDYASHPDFYSQNGSMEPDAFDKYTMEFVTPPPRPGPNGTNLGSLPMPPPPAGGLTPAQRAAILNRYKKGGK